MKDYRKLIAQKEAELEALKKEAAEQAKAEKPKAEDLFEAVLGLNIAKAIAESMCMVAHMMDDDEEDTDAEEDLPEDCKTCPMRACEDADEEPEDEEDEESDGVCVDVSSLINEWRGYIQHMSELTETMKQQLEELDAFIAECDECDNEEEACTEAAEEDATEEETVEAEVEEVADGDEVGVEDGKEEVTPDKKPDEMDPSKLIMKALDMLFSNVQLKKSEKSE